MVALLESLVKIDSGSYDKPGIDQVILLLKQQVEKLGLQTQLIDFPDRGNHLVARKPGLQAELCYWLAIAIRFSTWNRVAMAIQS
jgi:hypothetical protein